MSSVSMLGRAVAQRDAKHVRRGRGHARAAVPVASRPTRGAARKPAALDATLARCVEQRADTVPAPPGLLQRSCLKATERDGLLYLDEPDKREVERQGLEDGAAVQSLLMRGAFMIALARLKSQSPVVSYSRPVDVEDDGPRERSWGTGGRSRTKKYSYRSEPYPTDRVRPYGRSGVRTSSYIRSPLMVSTKSTAVGDVKNATANATLTVNTTSHNVRAWNVGAHPAKAPIQHYSTKYGLGAHGTATQAKLVRSHTRTGSGVGTTRPDDWTDFTALLGMAQNGQIAGKMRWVQGHFINEHLGGRGEQQNLAPFTRSLNTRHYHAVEKHVIKSIGAGETVDYSVQAIPSGPGTQNETDSIGWHRAARANYPQAMLNAMVAVGALDAGDAANLTAGVAHPGTTATPASKAPTLAGVEAVVETWIRNYVRAAFPDAIACRMRYYTPVLPGQNPAPQTAKGQPAAHASKSVGEVVIDNRR